MKKLLKHFSTARDTVESMWGMCDYGCNCSLPPCPCNMDMVHGTDDSYSVYTDEAQSLKNTAYRAEIE